MEMLPVTPERKAQLEEYAQLHEQTPAEALDDLLSAHLAWEEEEHEDTVQALLEAEADIAAGRTRPAEEVYASMRLKHGLQD
jgi:thioredoxin-like negative regulator of GroEL